MQTLYTIASSETGDNETLKSKGRDILEDKLSRSLDLFVISILYTLRVAEYAEKDARVRAAKYLPTEEDLKVNTKISGNEFLWRVKENQTFIEKVKESKLEHFIDDDQIKKIYQRLVKAKEYIAYAEEPSRESKKEVNIIKFIWDKLIYGDEDMQEFFTDELSGWDDDKQMTSMLMDNFFKSSHKVNFLNLISAEKKEYSISLLETVIDKEAYSMELIQPKLINWDAERVALIDLLLLRMGVAELLYFPTIPTKVTINEYIEIAKLYSTPQSGQFINGVLDNTLKDLLKENKINKEERNRK